MAIPLIDIKVQYKELREEIMQAIQDVLAGGEYILGSNVTALEAEIAGYCGTSYGIGVASGTDALILSLLAAGIGAGDEVITTPFSFFATAGAIARVGAKPVFVDIEPDTFNISPQHICNKITPRTKAIVPVHIFGQTANMEVINELAKQFNLTVIEDACQAIGALYKGQKAGSLGSAGCFSFFPTKNLGGYGDGGMVVTNDGVLAEKIRMLRVHGSTKKYYHRVIGYNSRLDEIQAAIIRVKLRHLDKWNQERRRLSAQYAKLCDDLTFEGFTLRLPKEESINHHVYHLYTVRCSHRDKILKELTRNNIAAGVYYPLPLHLQEAFNYLGYRKGDLPEAELASREVLSLPLYAGLDDSIVKRVVDVLKS